MSVKKIRLDDLTKLVVIAFQNGALYGHNLSLISSGEINNEEYDDSRDEIFRATASIGDVISNKEALDRFMRDTKLELDRMLVRPDGTTYVPREPVLLLTPEVTPDDVARPN